MRAIHIPRYTVEDYVQWEGKWELISGIPHAMSPSPVKRHQRLSVKLTTCLEIELSHKKPACKDCELVHELDWRIDNETVLCPDLAIICNEVGNFIIKAPVLIIEILSPSTALKDRHTKHEIYQEQGVKYYIIADADAKTYNTHVLIDGQYQEQNTKEFTIHDGCTINLDVAQVMAEV